MADSFPGYRFAGICDAEHLGFGVEDNARRLHRVAYVEQRSMFVEAGHLLGTPEWEIKHLLGRHLYEDAEHHDSLRTRITELRRSDQSVDTCPSPALDNLMNEVIWADGTVELLSGIYCVIKPALVAAYQRHLAGINPLVDYPTGRVLRQIVAEEEEHIILGHQYLESLLVSDELRTRSDQWITHLQPFMDAAGGVDGLGEESAELPVSLSIPHNRTWAWQMPMQPGRDSRFTPSVVKDPCLRVIGIDDLVKQGMEQMMWVRFHEMSPAETVAAIMTLQKGMPWPFYHDLARHCWDELRHSAFGQAALQAGGIDILANPNWTGFSTICLSEFTPMEAYIHLTIAVEQSAMKYPPGKRQEYEFCRDTAQHALMTLYQDYDWADEVNHAQFGQEWVVRRMYKGDRHAAIVAGEETMRRRYAFFAKYAVNGVVPDGTSRDKVGSY